MVVLHGFTGSAAAMGSLVDALAGAHRVVAIELPGYGSKPRPTSATDLTVDSVLRDVDRVVRSLSLGSWHLVGYSMGGRIALAYAAAGDDGLASLTTISASPGIADPARRAARAASDAELADRIERRGIEWFADYWSSQAILQPASPVGIRAGAAIRSLRLLNDPVSLAAALRGLGPGSMPPLHDRLADIEVPALLVAGRADPKYVEISAAMGKSMPEARVRVIDDAGHAVHLDKPEELAAEILSFVGAVDEGAAP